MMTHQGTQTYADWKEESEINAITMPYVNDLLLIQKTDAVEAETQAITRKPKFAGPLAQRVKIL